MNKLKQLYKTFLFKWNDKTLYKTSLTTKGALFKYNLLVSIGVIESITLLCVGEKLLDQLAILSLMMCLSFKSITSEIYKSVADRVKDTE